MNEKCEKNSFFRIFFMKNYCMSKKSSNFAADFGSGTAKYWCLELRFWMEIMV